MKRALLGLSVLLALGVNGASSALGAIPIPAEDNREASFLPPPLAIAPQPESAPAVAPAAAPPTDQLEPPVNIDKLTVEDNKATPSVIAPVQPAVPATTNVPAAALEPKPEVTVIQGAPPVPAVQVDAPVTSKPLADVDPEAMGVLSNSSGGLGASLWQGTLRGIVDKLMPAVFLPAGSPTLNDLAGRLFLTAAAVPAGSSTGGRSLTSMRIEKLLELGHASAAWKLTMMADPARVDDITLRRLTEAMLLTPETNEACGKIQELIAARNKPDEAGIEWQKALIICKLRAKDDAAVQLGLDLLREQKAKDDIFLSLMNKNILAQSKQLPRQLTPLRAITLAALRVIDLPLPPELYARPEAALIDDLLKAKAVDEKARLQLAERAAAQGVLSGAQLASVYGSVLFTPEEISGSKDEGGPRGRALLYQAAFHEQSPQKKADLALKLIESAEPPLWAGGMASVVAELIGDRAPVGDDNIFAGRVAKVMAVAGKTERAAVWLKLAQGAGERAPALAAQLIEATPIFILAGLVPDGEHAEKLKLWLDRALETRPEDEDRARRQKASRILMALSAAGYAVPDEAWLRVLDAMPPMRQMVADPLLSERLRAASSGGRKGETILLSLLVAGGGPADAPIGSTSDVIRALRLSGLTAEAQALAREAVLVAEK